MMAMDECVPSTSDHATAAAAMHRTHRWAARSLAARGDAAAGALRHRAGRLLRRPATRERGALTRLPFDGFAIGGLAVGEDQGRARALHRARPPRCCPRDLPRYLMGVGTPLDLLEAVDRGVDMFDCIDAIGPREAGRGVHVEPAA